MLQAYERAITTTIDLSDYMHASALCDVINIPSHVSLERVLQAILF